MDKLAKSMKLDVTDSIDFGHADSVEGLGSAAFVEDAFNKPVGSVIGPVNVQGRDIVYQVVDRKAADLSKLAQDRAAIVERSQAPKRGAGRCAVHG